MSQDPGGEREVLGSDTVGGSGDPDGWGPGGGELVPVGAGTSAAPVGVIAPSRFDPVARVASQVIGGPAGRRSAAATGLLRALPVLVLLSMMVFGFSVIQREHCRAHGWSTPDQFWHLCYSDIPVRYSSAGLAGPGRPSLVEAVSNGKLNEPPLISAAMWATSGLVDTSNQKAAQRRFFDLSAIFLGMALAGSVLLVGAVTRRRPWDAAHLALSPVLVTAGLVSYDLLAVLLMTASLVAWGRRKPVLGGVLLGLSVLAQPLTIVVAGAVIAVGVRAGKPRSMAYLGMAALTWLGIRVVLFPGLNGGITAAWDRWKEGSPGYGSIWLAPQLMAQARPGNAGFWYTGPGVNAAAATAGSLIGLAAVLATGILVALVSRHRPRVGQLALFLVAGALLVAKEVPVQVSLLLLPLIAMAGLRWRDHLLWATTELLYFGGIWLFIAASSSPNRGLPAGFYLLLMLLRLAGIAWIGWMALRAALDPLRDPIRVPEDGTDGTDDPLGGVVEGEPDALVVRLV